MFKVETLEVAGLYPAMKALRLPYGRECRSQLIAGSYSLEGRGGNDEFCSFESHQRIEVCKKDLELAERLVKGADCEAKAMRGIVVWAEITAPLDWWSELETYRAGHERLSSESKMHCLYQGLAGEELQKARQETSAMYELTKIDSFSYQALRNIHFWRKCHRLPEWRVFCKWIEGLPLAKELIYAGDKEANLQD